MLGRKISPNIKTASKLKVKYASKQRISLLIMVLPGIIAMMLFFYYPFLGNIIAFKDYRIASGIFGSEWSGLSNFRELFYGIDFWNKFRNTLVISILKLVCGFPAPIILALMLVEVPNLTFKRIVQTCSYLPHFFSWIVLGGIFMSIFSTNGPVNTLMSFLGNKEPIMFFGENMWFLFLIVFSAVWQGVGWSAILYLAVLSGIDPNLYEAAVIDGASRWRQVIHISIPHLIPTIVTIFILNLGHLLNAGFDQIYNMHNPTVYDVADILDTYTLMLLQNMEYGIGAAAGLVQSAIGFGLVLLTNSIIKRLSNDEFGIF